MKFGECEIVLFVFGFFSPIIPLCGFGTFFNLTFVPKSHNAFKSGTCWFSSMIVTALQLWVNVASMLQNNPEKTGLLQTGSNLSLMWIH